MRRYSPGRSSRDAVWPCQVGPESYWSARSAPWRGHRPRCPFGHPATPYSARRGPTDTESTTRRCPHPHADDACLVGEVRVALVRDRAANLLKRAEADELHESLAQQARIRFNAGTGVAEITSWRQSLPAFLTDLQDAGL